MTARRIGRRIADTSLAAYECVDLGRRQLEVLDAIADLCRMGRKPSDSDLAQFLSWPISWVTPRRGELQAAGRIEHAGSKLGEYGRKVAVWKPVQVALVQLELPGYRP